MVRHISTADVPVDCLYDTEVDGWYTSDQPSQGEQVEQVKRKRRQRYRSQQQKQLEQAAKAIQSDLAAQEPVIDGRSIVNVAKNQATDS